MTSPTQGGEPMVTAFARVKDVDATLARAVELGGRIVQPAQHVPGVTSARSPTRRATLWASRPRTDQQRTGRTGRPGPALSPGAGLAPRRRARQTGRVTAPLSIDQVLRHRARVSHLDRKLPAGSFAEAAWGGLQDSVPRSGVISLHARVAETKPDSWEDPSDVQIWFRGGADYLVPREDAGIFTLGSYPRDPERAAEIERLADAVHRVARGETLKVAEVSARLAAATPVAVRYAAPTGRVHIRWDASNIWLIPVDRPDLDVEDARRQLACRFIHWFGPTTRAALARWTGVKLAEATETWRSIESELTEVELQGERRFMLTADIEAARSAERLEGVRLLPFDDAYTKLDRELLLPDPARRDVVLPRTGKGHIPGAILVDGEIVGSWQRQQRKVTTHPFGRLPVQVRDAIEAEALSFPIAGASPATVAWA
jgi:hypothetical protein